jgi:probable blue pigment (indigoidine) exporter
VLSQEDASVVSVFVFTVPVVGVFVSWLILGEHVGRELLLGGGLVVLGIVFVHWPRPRTASRLPRPAP